MHGRLIERMSPSGFDTFHKCEAQWAFRYLEGLVRKPSAAMAAGNAFDDTANAFYLERMAFERAPTPGETVDLFAAAWGVRQATVDDWQDEEAGAVLDEGVALVSLWHKRIALHVIPHEVQPRIALQVDFGPTHAEANDALGLSNGMTLTGFADVLGTVPKRGRTIIDHKFSRRSWSLIDVMRETQPAVYALGRDVPTFQYHIARRGLATPQVKILTRTIDEDDARGIFNRYAIVRRKVMVACNSGDFLPNRKQPLCSRRWCGYWEECEKRFGGRVPA